MNNVVKSYSPDIADILESIMTRKVFQVSNFTAVLSLMKTLQNACTSCYKKNVSELLMNPKKFGIRSCATKAKT